GGERVMAQITVGIHGIDTGAGRLHHLIADTVDRVAVVAGAALHVVVAFAADKRVGAAAALQGIVAVEAPERGVGGVAGDQVVAAVAGAVDGGDALQHQVLEAEAQREIDRRVDRILAGTEELARHVADIVDIVHIVAGAAGHGVGAAAAVEDVVVGSAAQVV